MSVQNPVEVVPIPLPPPEQRVRREARFAAGDEQRSRYSLPIGLDSSSPVGYRTRIPLSRGEAEQAMALLSLERPTAFIDGPLPSEQELFEEGSLGILRARQSTNFRGHRQVTVGPEDSVRVAELLRSLQHLDAPVLDGASHTHICLSRPYRTPFTMLLTFIGHKPVVSALTVPLRGLRKRFQHADDIPTIGYLQHLHLGIWADDAERAAVIASDGRRKANVLMGPFSSPARRADNAPVLAELAKLAGISSSDRSLGWRIALVIQVGTAESPTEMPRALARKLGANLLAFRSERIQPGVNQESKAPAPYQERQDMRVPDELAFMAGRAAYNAFAHWTGCDRERAKELLLMERVDVLTESGKQRLRAIRQELADISDRVVGNIPLWADLPLLKALSRNAARGKKAFALAGQRIYIGGLSQPAVAKANLDWEQAVMAFGAAAARSSLTCEIMGCVELPEDCDLLAGICLMAGPVNQNDVGKSFYGYADLLEGNFPGQDPTSLLVWTLKAKTVADPIGNEEQLLNPARKGALVDLRPGPHEVIQLRQGGALHPMRQRDGRVNGERAYADVGNFVHSPSGEPIPGNRGSDWPESWSQEIPWPT